ncbi:MAG: penicillin acylase family protein [Armatimonas sp.]
MTQGQTDWDAQARAALAQVSGTLTVRGLSEPVTVHRDPWGVPHIFAQNSEDLFFAQGFVAAQDRLFQMELWKREGQGRLAEVIGPDAVERDRMARLVRYRGDLETEWASYAPGTREIADAFTRGINAFIAQENLPVEFSVAGFVPEPWVPEDLLSRFESAAIAIYGPLLALLNARLVATAGAERASELLPGNPPAPLTVPEGLDLSFFDEPTTKKLGAMLELMRDRIRFSAMEPGGGDTGGSNNWVISGEHTASGKPLLANDPHRAITLPSNRYIVHLNCPGWNVIGATYPHLPGVQIGHNDHVAWGLTINGPVDADLYQEELETSELRTLTEQIMVKGEAEPRTIELRWSRHGAILLEDMARQRAVAIRFAASAPGAAPYLAAIGLNQAKDAAELRQGLSHWKAPAQNFVFADVQGNIGMQVAAQVPVRADRSYGRLPYPGGSGEAHTWERYLAFTELPQASNPPDGILVTANHNVLPPGYPHLYSANFAPAYRADRIRSVLESSTPIDVDTCVRLQNDTQSPTFFPLRPLLESLRCSAPKAQQARELLLAWDGHADTDSTGALLSLAWMPVLLSAVARALPPAGLAPILFSPPAPALGPVLAALTGPAREADWGAEPEQRRHAVVEESLILAWETAANRLGPDPQTWTLGQVQKAPFPHPLSARCNGIFDLPATPHGGVGLSVNAFWILASGLYSGASYRHVMDLADWDNSRAINTPGQSGQPFSPHYADLLPFWAAGETFPLLFTRSKIEAAGGDVLTLTP